MFAAALTNTQQYWPIYFPWEAILKHFKEKLVGSVDAILGMLDDVKYNIWWMKEPDYVVQIIASGALCSQGGCEVKWQWTEQGVSKAAKFAYCKLYEWYLKYWRAVDDHNNLWNGLPSLDDTWMTKRLPVRMFFSCFQ